MRINLNSPDGNAFAIMAIVRGYLRAVGQAEKVQSYFDEAKSSDYHNLLKVSKKYCPDLSSRREAKNDQDKESSTLR